MQLPKTGRQLTQVGRVKEMPYVFFGLGRTNNYVNYLTITVPFVNILLIIYRFLWISYIKVNGHLLYRILRLL
jgi:hypothetical protein